MFKHYVLMSYIVVYINQVNSLYNENQFKSEGESWQEVENGWIDKSVQLGQLSGVAVDNSGNVLVFHRGGRVWDVDTFSQTNVYLHRNIGPIMTNTVLAFNRANGTLTDAWGSNKFYMPHGLTVDLNNNIWLTDVALHQVFKFPGKLGSQRKEILTLGTRFIPGNDNEHFCKPTSVAVMSSDDFFVADGYCNSRIVKYSSEGKFIMQWGTNTYQGNRNMHRTHYTLAVPHGLALIEDLQQLCVADRENGRVLCYDCHNGTYIWMFNSSYVGSRLFSLTYAPVNKGQLYIVNGPSPNIEVGGFVIDIHTNSISSRFGHFSNPHDITVTSDGSEIYVVELEPFLVHKFMRQTKTSVPKQPTVVSSTVVTGDIHSASVHDVKYRIWIIAGASALGIILILVCAIYVMVRLLSRRKKNLTCSIHDISPGWIRPGGVDKVFRLDKLNKRKNKGHGFQPLKTDDESDEDSVPMVNI